MCASRKKIRDALHVRGKGNEIGENTKRWWNETGKVKKTKDRNKEKWSREVNRPEPTLPSDPDPPAPSPSIPQLPRVSTARHLPGRSVMARLPPPSPAVQSFNQSVQ
jgi:hypothetical protein